MNRNLFLTKLVSCIVILSLLYSNCVYAISPYTHSQKPDASGSNKLAKTGEPNSPEFRELIKPLALIANLFDKRDAKREDLVFIKSTLIEFLGWSHDKYVTLAYNKKGRELFIYNKDEIVSFSFTGTSRGKRVKLEEAIEQEEIGKIKIARYRFAKENEGSIKAVKGVIVIEPEQEFPISLQPEGLRSKIYLGLRGFRFWIYLGLFSTATLGGLIVYAFYSIAEYFVEIYKKWRLTDAEFQTWLERKRYLLLLIGVPVLRILPFLHTEFRDIVPIALTKMWSKSKTYSTHRIDDKKVLAAIQKRHKSTPAPTDEDWIGSMVELTGIFEELGNSELLQILDTIPVYLVGPGHDVNNPFIFYDRKTASYIYSFVTGELPDKLDLGTRLWRFFTTGNLQWLSPESLTQKRTSAIYISKVFYEQIKGHKTILMTLLSEKIIELAYPKKAEADKIKAQVKSRIEVLDTKGISLDHVRTIIKDSYFIRESEKFTSEWSEGRLRELIRKMILRIITWSRKFYGWDHFMKSFMAEFFTITLHWLRTPFVYPLRENLHCGMPIPQRPLPEYGTYLWAIQLGFSDEAARIIGEADTSIDNLTSGWIPRIGDQSRHYNMYQHDRRWRELWDSVSHDLSKIEQFFTAQKDREIRENYTLQRQFEAKPNIELMPDKKWSEVNYPDTRLDWAQFELEKAASFYRIGEQRLAMEALGRGLHSLQDLIAHGDYSVGPFGTRMHPPEWDDPDYDIETNEGRRVKETERLSKDYLQIARDRFLKIDEELALNKGYFVETTDRITRRFYFDGDKKGSVEVLTGRIWIEENTRFRYTRIGFKDGLGVRQAHSVRFVAGILHALTGISTTISRVDKYPFPEDTASASDIMEELALEAHYNTQVMVTVEGDVAEEFLENALDIIINKVLGDEIFDKIGINPPDKDLEAKEQRALFIQVSDKREYILRLINELALDIKKAEEDKKHEALAQKYTRDTYTNLRLAVDNGVIAESEMDRFAGNVYFLLARLNEIKEETTSRPVRSLVSEVPREPDKTLPYYTKEFLEYGILTGLIVVPLAWYKEISILLGEDYTLTPSCLQSLDTWIEVAQRKSKENPDLSVLEIRNLVADYFYQTFGEIAARTLGEVEVALDVIADGMNKIKPLNKRINSILSRIPKDKLSLYHEYLVDVIKQQLTATRIVGLGLLSSGVPPPELQRLLLGDEQVDVMDAMGVGKSAASLERTGRFRAVNTWDDIYDYIQSLTRIGKKPKRILVDLDMTVFTPMGFIGSMPWFEHKLKEVGRYKTLYEWGDNERSMTRNGFYRLVDPKIPKIIEKLKAEGIEVVGFTARMWRKDSRRTKKILKKLGIKFSDITSMPGIYYHGGVIYTYGQGIPKARVLRRLTATQSKSPTLLIDDNLINLTNMINDEEFQNVYGLLYRSPAREGLLMTKAQDYVQLGDEAMDRGESTHAQWYYLNAVEKARLLEIEETSSVYRDIWQRIAKLREAGKDTGELVRFLVRYDRTKYDLRIMEERLKDPYLDLLVRIPPITDREKPKVLVCQIDESTDLNLLKYTLRVVRDTRRKDNNPKIRTVLTSNVPPALIRQKIKEMGLEEGIDYDLWYIPKGTRGRRGTEEEMTLTSRLRKKFKEFTLISSNDIVTINVTDSLQSIPQLIYEGIARSEGYDIPVIPGVEISRFSHIDLISLKEKAKARIEFLDRHRNGNPIVLFYNQDIDSISAASAEARFLKEYFEPDLEIIYIPVKEGDPLPLEKVPAGSLYIQAIRSSEGWTEGYPYCLYTSLINGEALRQSKDLTSAGLYLEQTSWLATLAIYGIGSSLTWKNYLSRYGWDKIGLDKLAERINLACAKDQEVAQLALRDLVNAPEPTSKLSREFESRVGALAGVPMVTGDGNEGGGSDPRMFMAGRSMADVYALTSLRYRYFYDFDFAVHDYDNVLQDIETLIRFDRTGKPISNSINRTNLFLLRLELERRKGSQWPRRLVLFSTKKDLDIDAAMEMLGFFPDRDSIGVIQRNHYEHLVRGPHVANALLLHYPLSIHGRVEILTIEENYDLWKDWLNLPVKFVDNRCLPVDEILRAELERIGLERLIQEDERVGTYIDISHEIPSLDKIEQDKLRSIVEEDERYAEFKEEVPINVALAELGEFLSGIEGVKPPKFIGFEWEDMPLISSRNYREFIQSKMGNILRLAMGEKLAIHRLADGRLQFSKVIEYKFAPEVEEHERDEILSSV